MVITMDVSSSVLSWLMADHTLHPTISALKKVLSVCLSEPYGGRRTRQLRMKRQCFRYCSGHFEHKQLFFVVEHLTRLKFKFLGSCNTGPVRQTNLIVLITFADSKSIVPLEALVRCFSGEVCLSCPENVSKM